MSDLREAIARTVAACAHGLDSPEAANPVPQPEDYLVADALVTVFEAYLREHDAAARQRIEALWDRQAVTGFPEEFYNRALGDVLEALGGGDE